MSANQPEQDPTLFTNDQIRARSAVILVSDDTACATEMLQRLRKSQHLSSSLVRNINVLSVNEALLYKNFVLKNSSNGLIKMFLLAPVEQEQLSLQLPIGECNSFDAIMPINPTVIDSHLKDVDGYFFVAANQMLSAGSNISYFKEMASIKTPCFNLHENAKAALFFSLMIKQKEAIDDQLIDQVNRLGIKFNQEAVLWCAKTGNSEQLKTVIKSSNSDCGALEIIAAGLMGAARLLMDGKLDPVQAEKTNQLYLKLKDACQDNEIAPKISSAYPKSGMLIYWLNELDSIIPEAYEKSLKRGNTSLTPTIH